MQNYIDSVTDTSGRAIAGATVTVQKSDGTAATLYAANGSSPYASNVLTTDNTGEYRFYAANGTYTITVSSLNFAGQTNSGVVLYDPADVTGVNPKDAAFGARGDGITDDTAAILAADTVAAAAGKPVVFPPGTFIINLSGMTGSGATWVGSGRNTTTLKAAAGAWGAGTQRMLTVSGKSGFTISKITFDLSATTATSASFVYAFLPFNCNNWHVYDCGFVGIQPYMYGVYGNGGSNWSVCDNWFFQATPSIHRSQAVNVQYGATNFKVSRNVAVGTAIFSNASYGEFAENVITGWGFGGGITIDSIAATRNTGNVITGNTLGNSFSTGAPDDNATYPPGIECSSSVSTITGNLCFNNGGSGITVFGPNCTIVGNTCANNGQISGPRLAGIVAYAIPQSVGGDLSANGSVIANNTLIDNQGSPTQNYGYAEFNITNGFGTGALSGMVVHGNKFSGNAAGDTSFVAGSSGATLFNGAVSVGLLGVGALAANNVAIQTKTSLLTGTTQVGVNGTDTFTSAATAAAYEFYSTPTTQAAVFTLPTIAGFFAKDAIVGSGSTITTQYGFFAGNLSAATNNFAFYSNMASGAGKFGFYAAGTAQNLLAGPLNLTGAAASVASGINLGGTTSGTATAGAATLPANPLGFLVAFNGATQVKIPYYSA